MNSGTTKDQTLNLAPLTELGYPRVREWTCAIQKSAIKSFLKISRFKYLPPAGMKYLLME